MNPSIINQNSDKKEDSVYTYVEDMPSFPGGQDSLYID